MCRLLGPELRVQALGGRAVGFYRLVFRVVYGPGIQGSESLYGRRLLTMNQVMRYRSGLMQ